MTDNKQKQQGGGAHSLEEENHAAMLIRKLDCAFRESLSGDDLLTAQIQSVATRFQAFGSDNRTGFVCDV